MASQTKRYRRRVSPSERRWLVSNDSNPSPFLNQMVLEGQGPIDTAGLENAIVQASAANPGSRLRLRGALRSLRWVDSGETPPLREVDGSDWDGMSGAGAPFLHTPLAETTGPTCDVILLQGQPQRLIFRSHHAVMDGLGTQAWVEDIFRVLRGEAPIGSRTTLNDEQLLRQLNEGPKQPAPLNTLAVTGKPQGRSDEILWVRRRIEGKYPKLVAQVCALIADEAFSYQSGKVALNIPVNIRPRFEGELRSTANLWNAIYVLPSPGTTYATIAEDLKQQLAGRNDCRYNGADRLLPWIPLGALKSMGRKMAQKALEYGRFPFTAIVSNIGLIDLDEYTGGGFTPQRCFFIPPGAGGTTSAFFVLTGSAGGVDLTYAMPRSQGGEGRLEQSMDNIINGLEPAASPSPLATDLAVEA